MLLFDRTMAWSARAIRNARSGWSVIIVGSLSIAIVLFIVGVSISFGDLADSGDEFGKSIQEAFALIDGQRPLILMVHGSAIVFSIDSEYRYLRQSGVFHPPPSGSRSSLLSV